MAINERSWDRGFTVDFNRINGKSTMIPVTIRHLSEMRELFLDQKKEDQILKHVDPVIYETYRLDAPKRTGDLSFGTTIVHPGVIGNEYHMTRGHFRRGKESACVIYTLTGDGYLVMENRNAESIVLPLREGEASYVPRDFAYRLVNCGPTDLIVYYTSNSEKVNEYDDIAESGFRSMIIEKQGYPAIVENPRWTEKHN